MDRFVGRSCLTAELAMTVWVLEHNEWKYTEEIHRTLALNPSSTTSRSFSFGPSMVKRRMVRM